MRFLMVDRLTALRPDEYACGIRAVTGSEDFFADHFPGNPVMPGVLILESMAQTGGALIGLSSNLELFGVMTIVENAKFRSHVRPGDVLELHVTVLARDSGTMRVSARALVGGREAASANLAYVLLPLDRVIGTRYLEFWRDLMRSWAAGIEAQPVGSAV